MFQYHYNFLFPKIGNIALQFHFLINKIYSVCVNAKCSLKWWIFQNLKLVAWTEKRDFWSCLVHGAEIARCFLAVNSIGSWFNYFLRVAGIKTPRYNTYMLQWSYKTIGIHFNLIFTWLFKNLIVKMQNICNLTACNSVHIFDIFNCYRANINGMWNAEKLGGIYKTFEFTLT